MIVGLRSTSLHQPQHSSCLLVLSSGQALLSCEFLILLLYDGLLRSGFIFIKMFRSETSLRVILKPACCFVLKPHNVSFRNP